MDIPRYSGGEGTAGRPLAVYSANDLAGRNIARNILDIDEFNREELGGSPFWTGKTCNMLEVKGRLVDQDGIDTRIREYDLEPPLIIFASRHRSDDGRAVLTAHHTGNPGAAELGGSPGELSRPAPGALRAAYHALLRHCPEGFNVTLEATHHGPSSVDIPSLFIEIGSDESTWELPGPGEAVARSVLEAAVAVEAEAVLVSFGGTHYAPRQSRLLAETRVSFGHIFANHSVADVDDSVLRKAFELSGTNLAHFDRKGISAAQRDRILELLENYGVTVLGENEIRDQWPSGNTLCPLIALAPTMHGGVQADVTAELLCALAGCECGIPTGDDTLKFCPALEELALDDELVSLCMRLNRTGTTALISGLPVAYNIGKGGGKAVMLWVVKDDLQTERNLVDGLFSLLAERGKLEFERASSMLTLTEKKFDPALARDAGVEPGPDYSRLAAGEAVRIAGRVVKPEDVLKDVTTQIKLRRFSDYAASLPCE